jgi:undecaprenyl-diphosphatase
MTFFESIVIAVVEGLTEFLPISSTAHIKFTQSLMGIQSSAFDEMFDVVIQLAAILAVVVIYYKKFFDFKRIGFYVKLIIALIPAIIVGTVLKKYLGDSLKNIQFMAWVMLVGGIILLFIDNLFKNPVIDSEEKVTNKTAFIIGCGQILSLIFPGLSRSAATIITGMSQKLTRTAAAEFSFFLAVPTMLAASAKSFLDTYKDHPEVFSSSSGSILLVGSAVSFVVALIAIKFFIGFLQKHGFKIWGIYRIIIGTVMLVLIWKKII